MTTATQTNQQQEVRAQAAKMLGHFAGHVAFKTIETGLKSGLLAALATHKDGLRAAELASAAGTDPFYTEVWAKAAYGCEVLEIDESDRYSLAPHMEKLLLDENFPGYVGGIPGVLGQPEVFDNFAANLRSGKRTWWNEVSQDFIGAVTRTGWPFYNRLIPGGLERVPGLADLLSRNTQVLELASGAGRGIVKLARLYPQVELVGVDGDAYSAGLARENVKQAGLDERITIAQSTLEDFEAQDRFDMAFINISMHECRDIEQVARNVMNALKPDGIFVISDFPFPAGHSSLRTVPARVMSGIQFFEATIDDQLLPTQSFVELLNRNGFRDVASFELTPMHSVIHGRK